MTENKKLGDQIARARVALGMTQPELAKRLGAGASVKSIQNWEAGKNPPRDRTLSKPPLKLPRETS